VYVWQVTPSKDQYQANIYEGLGITTKSFIGECHEQMMVNGLKRDREKGEAKLKFEVSIELYCITVNVIGL